MLRSDLLLPGMLRAAAGHLRVLRSDPLPGMLRSAGSRSAALGSAALLLAHGPSALWKKAETGLLTCEHDEALSPPFSALLFAFVNIIPQSV